MNWPVQSVSDPTMRLRSLVPLLFLLPFFSSTLSDSPVGSLRRLSVSRYSASFSSCFYNWTLNPFHMMGAGILSGALLSAIHGVTVENTLYQDGEQQQILSHLTQLKKKKPTQWLREPLLVSDLIAFSNKRCSFLYAVCSCYGSLDKHRYYWSCS